MKIRTFLSLLAVPALIALAAPARATTAGVTTSVGAGGGGAGGAGGGTGAGGAVVDPAPRVESGCACAEAGRSDRPPALLALALAAGALALRRRYSAPKWTSE